MSRSIYEELSQERKNLQELGEVPDWYTTGSWQMFKEKYRYNSIGFKEQARRIAHHMAQHAPSFLESDHPYFERITKNYGGNWEDVFFQTIWKGHLALSSPVLANGGTDRGSPVSCSGAYVDDSIQGFYNSRYETALLTKEGFGTSAYLGDVRPRGSVISKGGKATGSWPVFQGFTQDSKDVSQAGIRRGSWAGYIEIDHEDFDEWSDNLHKNPQGMNVGWIITKSFINKCEEGDEDSLRRFQKALWIKMQTGKGYFWKVDHVNDQQPQMYKDLGLRNKASNLCLEIVGHADQDHTYTCILSSMNAYSFDEFKEAGGVFVGTVFLDCVTEDFIQRGKSIPGLEKAVRFTEKSRMLGLGLLGFHSYLQKNKIAFEDFEAHLKNTEIFKHLSEESLDASKWMAESWGEPLWCEGYGVRNTHRLACAPNMSSATIAGQVSQGIEPWIANIFMQGSAGGEMQRINPELLKIMTERGKYNKRTLSSIIDNQGSVQHVDWLDEDEKRVFKTAFEIDQRTILRLASVRQKYICQGQSLNLFFDAEEDEAYIAQLHKEAFLDENIKGLYYIRTLAGVQASKDECVACEG